MSFLINISRQQCYEIIVTSQILDLLQVLKHHYILISVCTAYILCLKKAEILIQMQQNYKNVIETSGPVIYTHQQNIKRVLEIQDLF